MLNKTGTGTLMLNVSPVTFQQLNVTAGQVTVSTSVLTSRTKTSDQQVLQVYSNATYLQLSNTWGRGHDVRAATPTPAPSRSATTPAARPTAEP